MAPIGTTGQGYLLMRHGGALWGVENAAVASLTRGGAEGRRFRLVVGDPGVEVDLVIEEIVGVVADLTVWPLTAALRRFWPDATDSSGVAGGSGVTDTAAGLAVHAAQPLVVVDPRCPPRVLRAAPPPLSGDGRDREGAHRDG